jgi:hypothetical protein
MRPGAFARSVARRFGDRRGAPPHVPLVLRRAQRGHPAVRAYMRTLALQPRVDLRLTHVHRHASRTVERVERFHRERTAAIERLVERLQTRTTRVDSVVRHEVAPAAAALAAPLIPRELAVLLPPRQAPAVSPLPPAPAVLKRDHPTRTNAPEHASQELTPAGWASPLPAARRDTEPAAAAVDVAQLTDQVIDAIDRRLVAERERHGRL